MSNSYLTTLKGQLHELEERIADTQEMANDPVMRELIEKELAQLTEQKESLLETIDSIENPRKQQGSDPTQAQNAIVEIRAAAGGNEAGLFASDLYRMYLKFADSLGWKTEQLSINEGGIGNIKEVIFKITSSSNKTASPYSLLQYESGVHRVQRIPTTESSGRIHTSTATVAVLAEVKEQDIDLNPAELEFDTFRASGPGGQHVNKTESAIRVTHKPTGITVSCQEARSQLKNRETALNILRSRLYQKQQQEQQETRGAQRRSQIGSGERSEKIRTYNLPQDRVTDHRLGKSWHQIDKVMNGELMPILIEMGELEPNKS